MILTDESLALYGWIGKSVSYQVKPLIFKNQYLNLSTVVENSKNRYFQRNIPTKKYTLTLEVEYFTKLVNQDRVILYLFDPFYSKAESIKRIANWILPEATLISIPFHNTRSTLLYLLDQIDRWFKRSGDHGQTSHLSSLMEQINAIQKNVIEYIITPNPALFKRGGYLKHIKPTISKKKYHLLLCEDQRLKSITKSEHFEELWEAILQRHEKNHLKSVVTQAIEFEGPGIDFLHKQLEDGVPVHVPYVQISYLPNV